MITGEQTKAQRGRLPFGWGRFGKSIDALAELSTPDESLVAACVGLNPSFEHRSVTLAGGIAELTKATNVVLAVTDQRLLMVSTGFAGGTRDDVVSIDLDGLEVVSSGKTDVTLRWPEGTVTVKGCAKPMLPPLVEAIRAHGGPA